MSTYSITNAPRSFTLTETYHRMDRLNTLISVDTTHPDYDHVNMMWVDEQEKLKNMKNYANTQGENAVVYKRKTYGEHTIGRQYVSPFTNSHQSTHGPIRRLCIHGFETSIDIVNCHPTLVQQLVKKYDYGTKYPNLDNRPYRP